MTYEDYFKNKRHLDKKFDDYLNEKFGTKEWYEILNLFKHEWLSMHMEYKGTKILRIGGLTDKFNFKQLEVEIRAFTEYYAHNPDTVDLDS